MRWYSAVYNFIFDLWIFVSIFAVKIAKFFTARFCNNSPAPLIELPATSPTPSISYFAIARGHAQRFVAILFSAIHNLIRRISYSIGWHIPMYMRQISKAFQSARVAVVKFLANVLLHLAKAIHDTSVSERPAVRNIKIYCDAESTTQINGPNGHSSISMPWPSYQNYALNTGFVYAPLSSNISTVNLDQTAASVSNDTVTDTTPTPSLGGTLSSDSNWGLTPTVSMFGSESTSLSSLATPSQSPDAAFFNDLALVFKDTDNFNMDITDANLDNGISQAAIMEERNKLKDISAKPFAKGLDAASIHSFGQIERLFEDNYGKPASLAADDFFSAFGKRDIVYDITPPAPVTVFSARVYYDDVSPRSSLNFRLNALVSRNNSANSSLDGVYQNNTLMEEDITAAAMDAENCVQSSSPVSTVDSFMLGDISSPESNRSSLELSGTFSHHDNLLEEDFSIICAMHSPRESSIISAEDVSISELAYRNSLARSSVLLSPRDSILSQDSPEPPSENSSLQSSAVSSPLAGHLSPVGVAEADGLAYDDSISSEASSGLRKKSPSNQTNRLAGMMTSGLAIDIRSRSATIISPSVTSEEFSPPTFSGISIPSIVVSPVSEDTNSSAWSSPDFVGNEVFDEKNNIFRDTQQLHIAIRQSSVPAAEYTTVVQTLNRRVQSECATVDVHRSPSRSPVKDSGSRRVGLRGSFPRYRFSAPPDPPCATTNNTCSPSPDSRSLSIMPPTNDRRVGLLGTAPRHRFASTLSESPPSTSSPSTTAAARLVRAAHEARERAAVLERHRARARFFAQRDAAHGPGLRPLLLPLSVAAREKSAFGRAPPPTRFWGVVPF